MIKPTVVDLLRHGEVRGEQCFRGITDDPLSELGWRQMRQQCEGRQWDAVISSPLDRCLSFASDWARQHQLPLRIEEGWREVDFGDWEGLTAEQIVRQQPLALERFYADPVTCTPPNAESYRVFSERVRQAWQEMLREYAGQRLLVVTHAGVIRVLFAQVLAISPRHSFQIEIAHACLTRFSCFEDADGRFIQFNYLKPV